MIGITLSLYIGIGIGDMLTVVASAEQHFLFEPTANLTPPHVHTEEAYIFSTTAKPEYRTIFGRYDIETAYCNSMGSSSFSYDVNGFLNKTSLDMILFRFTLHGIFLELRVTDTGAVTYTEILVLQIYAVNIV